MLTPQVLRLPERTLKRRFATATGSTLIAYVQNPYIEEAKRLLEGENTAADIVAEQVGYEKPAFFRRLLKHSTGLTAVPAGACSAHCRLLEVALGALQRLDRRLLVDAMVGHPGAEGHAENGGRQAQCRHQQGAGAFVVFSRIDDKPRREGIGCVLADKGVEGLAVTQRFHTMGGENLAEGMPEHRGRSPPRCWRGRTCTASIATAFR